MRNGYSLAACIAVSIFLLFHRATHPGFHSDKPLNVTAWDAFGYYMYLPSAFIYHDMTQLEWLPKADSTYGLTGGALYQANRTENGNYVYKYLGGVAILQLPLFLTGHVLASVTPFEADGFSAPYQFAIAFGVVFYVILALFLLRFLLLRYFSDASVAISIMLLVMATNLPQYVSMDGGMSHAYIFPLYVLVLYTTMRWHLKPGVLWASLTGLIIGLSTICRPTEAIMVFIPLLWDTHTREAARAKWAKVGGHRSHLIYAVIFGFLGILPQLIYWKMASGSFIFDVGSKWVFFDPFFRVLFGWEAGWFIYTPVTILFILGFFFIRRYSFQRSVIVFCLLNIWIVISWFDWKYGATYSTRALVQSYPVFALPFTAILERINRTRWRYLLYLAGIYLIVVNLFQLDQYYRTVLHYRDMNRHYYARIYLNPKPTPLDMSLLDTRDFLKDEQGFLKEVIFRSDSIMEVEGTAEFPAMIAQLVLFPSGGEAIRGETWIRIAAEIRMDRGFENSYLTCTLSCSDTSWSSRVRLANPISLGGIPNMYEFYMKLPEVSGPLTIRISIQSQLPFEGTVRRSRIVWLSREK